MKKSLIIFIALSYGISNAQNFNSISLKKSYSSKEEFLKANPHLSRQNVSIDKLTISIDNVEKSTSKKISRAILTEGLNTFIFSPSREYFVAFEEAENATKELFFYSSSGVLLARQTINIYPNVKFSSNGEYVIVFNDFGRQIFVYNKTGSLIFSGDYIDIIQDKTKVLYNVIISDDSSEILINAGDNVYLVNSQSKRQIFSSHNVGRVMDAQFFSKQSKIALKTLTSKNGEDDLYLLSKLDGKTLDRISRVNDINFTAESIIIQSGSNLREYVVK